MQAPLALLVQYASLCAESAMHTPLSGYMPASLQRVPYLLPSMVIRTPAFAANGALSDASCTVTGDN